MRRAVTTLALSSCLLLSTGMGARADYPPRDAGYHSYAEMRQHIRDIESAHPNIVRVFSIGRSHQGRELWAAEISDNVGEDEGEPEVLFDGLHHAREHLSAEMAIAILDLLAGRYRTSGSIGRRVTRLVDERRTWIIFMVNPDGLVHDLTGNPYRTWRKNRQPNAGSSRVGTDLNRNYGYRFGCCGGSSGNPGSDFYRGPRAWSAPETRAIRDFVQSRVVDGRQRISAHITFHTAGEMVLWPYGYARSPRTSDSTPLDRRALKAMGKAMASRSGYRAKRSNDFYTTDGDMIDWMYGRQRIFSYTVELYPRSGGPRARYYPPDDIIRRETKRNRAAVLYLMGKAQCPYRALGRNATKAYCGPFFDDLEVRRGWRVDPDGDDDATDGRWHLGNPSRDGLQLGGATSGRWALVTGNRRGRDVDGGRTTVRSPLFRVPASGRSTLRLRYWVGLSSSAGGGDGLRIHLVDADGDRVATVLEVSGGGGRREPRWRSLAQRIPPRLGGQRVAIELEAVDAGGDAIVEAGVDQVRVTRG